MTRRTVTLDLHTRRTRATALAGLVAARPRSARRPADYGAVPKPWFRVSAAVDDTTPVYIYAEIGADWWGDGITAADFTETLAGIATKAITLHINSGGGDVFDAVAIHAALVNHPATVDVRIDGMAASAASFIAMAGDSIGIEKPALMMVHDASMLAYGNPAELREGADFLDLVSDAIAGVYADRAGGTVASWRQTMSTDAWFTSGQAVSSGLADQVLNDTAPAPAEGDEAPSDATSRLIRARARVFLGR